jgi:hypothetical protein
MRHIAHSPALTGVLAVAATLIGSGCDTPRAPGVRENLDSATGATAIVLSRPLELITEESRGTQRDPFAYLGPFVIDRMGARQRFLWVSVPQDNGIIAAVSVLCDGRPLELTNATPDLGKLGLTHPPYDPPAPWSRQWYFPLDGTALHCLSSATRVALEDHLATGVTERFDAQAGELPAIGAFAERDTSGQ